MALTVNSINGISQCYKSLNLKIRYIDRRLQLVQIADCETKAFLTWATVLQRRRIYRQSKQCENNFSELEL